MAARYSIQKSTTQGDQSAITEEIHKLQALDARFLDLATEDADAYTRLNRLQRLAPDDPDRKEQWKDAVYCAIDVPMRIVETSAKAIAVLQRLLPVCNPHLRSDLAISAVLAATTARTASWNVRVNLPLLNDPADRAALTEKMDHAIRAVQNAADRIEKECAAETG
jgi:glutamate formiminotransferase/formiminotetrahydrofolate cyclodeaminase